MKFEEHEGKLFRMLEEPVPLTTDAKLPCLVRLIQDDSRMGMFNRDTKPSRLSDFYLAARIVSNNIVVDEFMESDYNRFEIIGYPVEEGSAEWMIYQAMQGRKGIHPDITRPVHYDGECMTMDGDEKSIRMAPSLFISSYPSGWQIYKEPEPKPLLADAKVGDLCKTDLDEWIQIDDTFERPSPILYHFDRPFKGNIIHTEPLAPEGTAEWAWQMLMLGKTVYNPSYYYSSSHGLITPNMLGNCSKQSFVDRQEPSGWQLYEEPKPKPLLADAKVGDLCQRSNGRYTQFHSKHKLKNGSIAYYFTDASGSTDIDGNHCIHECGNNIVSCEPLATEGTAEWALQMWKLGSDIRNETGVVLMADYESEEIRVKHLVDVFPSGWQLYKEPKPEPPKEPDYVICKRCGGTGYEIKEQKPDDLYLNIKPSNPVDWCFDKKNLLVLVDDTFKGIVGENVTREQVGEIAKLLTEPEPEQPKYKVGDWVECVAKQGQTKLVDYLGGMGCYKTNYGAVISPCEILRKLSPSEVVVPITISGTVRQAYNEDGTIDDEQFQLLPNGSWDGTEMFISFDALDSHTRKLVESLLKAQEKECQ